MTNEANVVKWIVNNVSCHNVGVDCSWNDENKRYQVLLLKQLGGVGSKIMSMLNCFELANLDFSIIYLILKEGSCSDWRHTCRLWNDNIPRVKIWKCFPFCNYSKLILLGLKSIKNYYSNSRAPTLMCIYDISHNRVMRWILKHT